MGAGELCGYVCSICIIKLFRVHPAHAYVHAVRPTRVPERLSNGEISVREFGVLANDRNLNGWLLGNDLRNKLFPLGEIGNGGADSEFAGQKVAKAELLELQRHFIDGARSGCGDDRLYGYVCKEGNLLAHVIWDRMIGAEDDHVGLNAATAQLLH